MLDSPVRLPPGRAKLATSPWPSGLGTANKHNGIRLRRIAHGKRCETAGDHDQVNPPAHQLAGDNGQAVEFFIGVGQLERHYPALGPGQALQFLAERTPVPVRAPLPAARATRRRRWPGVRAVSWVTSSSSVAIVGAMARPVVPNGGNRAAMCAVGPSAKCRPGPQMSDVGVTGFDGRKTKPTR